MLVYSLIVDAHTRYFLSEQDARKALTAVEAIGATAEWQEPCDIIELLVVKDALLDKFSKQLDFLELQLEHTELGGTVDDLNLNLE